METSAFDPPEGFLRKSVGGGAVLSRLKDEPDRYRSAYLRVMPLILLVALTSRLEKYRTLTEAWLAKHEIKYDRLIMLDLPSKAERQRLGAHGSFKAEFYRKSDAILFIESEHEQALKIARLSGKPVLCVETNIVSFPDALSLPALEQAARNLPARLRQISSTDGRKAAAKKMARLLLGGRAYETLKSGVERPA